MTCFRFGRIPTAIPPFFSMENGEREILLAKTADGEG
jgi:hypothetical protein